MTKNYLFLFALLFAFQLASYAQTARQPVLFGVKAGLNLANFSDPDDILGNQDKAVLLAPHAGVFAVFAVGERFSVQPEALISFQGAKYNEPIVLDPGTGDPIAGDFESFSDEVTYLNIPVMLQFWPSEGFRLEAGPQLGFLLSAKGKVEGGGQTAEQDQKEYYSGIDFGIGLGLGYRLPVGLDFYGRYNLGLSNLLDEEITSVSDARIYNSVISIGVGYTF